MVTEAKIEQTIKELFAELDIKREPAGLYEPLRYMMAIGGKRVRPALCLTTYSLYKDGFTDEILQPATALEIFHGFTLIHDDIMDKSLLRRGVPTVWKKWDEDTAILSGDAMFIESFSRVSKAPTKVLRDVLDLFSLSAAQVCEGQQFDMDFEKLSEVPMDSYMEMIGLKTGVLIACAAKMGALIGGASEADCDNLYDYGYNMGLAFQVADDYLDAFGDEKVFGKPIGGDIVNNKKSWLTLRALEKASPETKSELFAAMDLPSTTEEERAAKIAAVKKFYVDLEVDKDAQAEIVRLNDKAMEYAAKVCKGVRYEMLKRFADRLVGRRK